MTSDDDRSPDVPQETEIFEQGDEALGEEERLNPAFSEAVQNDPSLDPTNVVDELELEEAGAELDNPEAMLVLPGGGDDPDGLGGPPEGDAGPLEEPGWDLAGADGGDDDDGDDGDDGEATQH